LTAELLRLSNNISSLDVNTNSGYIGWYLRDSNAGVRTLWTGLGFTNSECFEFNVEDYLTEFKFNRNLVIDTNISDANILTDSLVIHNTSNHSHTSFCLGDNDNHKALTVINEKLITGRRIHLIVAPDNVNNNYSNYKSRSPLVINSSGNVQICDTTSTQDFDKRDNPGLVINCPNLANKGLMHAFGYNSSVFYIDSDNCAVYNTSGIYGVTSDRRYKEYEYRDMSYNENCLEEISNLKLVSYNFKNNKEKKLLGLLAQDVESSGMTQMIEDKESYIKIKPLNEWLIEKEIDYNLIDMSQLFLIIKDTYVNEYESILDYYSENPDLIFDKVKSNSEYLIINFKYKKLKTSILTFKFIGCIQKLKEENTILKNENLELKVRIDNIENELQNLKNLLLS